MEFKEWINSKYLEYLNETGNPKNSESDFAQYLTDMLRISPDAKTWRLQNHYISYSTVSRWLAGSNLPERDNLWALVAIFGPEVCDVLGIPRTVPKDPQLRKIIELWLQADERQKKQIWSFLDSQIAQKITAPA